MEGLGKGVAIGLTSLAIAYVSVQLKNPYICWAFIAPVIMACDWNTTGKNDDEEE